jgi:hypothetical protein
VHITKVVGFQQFTSANLAAVCSVSTSLIKNANGDQANGALFSVGGSTGAVRWRDDGTAPTGTVGMRLASSHQPFLYQGDLHKLRFITESGIAEMNITYVQVTD